MVDLRPTSGGAKSAARSGPGDPEANGEAGMLAVLPQSIRGSVSFTSQHGLIDLASLPVVSLMATR